MEIKANKENCIRGKRKVVFLRRRMYLVVINASEYSTSGYPSPKRVLITQRFHYAELEVLVKTNGMYSHSMEYYAAIERRGNSLHTDMK